VTETEPNPLSESIAKHKSILRSSVPQDDVLSAVGRRAGSHAFLANCTQAVYARQVEFLSGILADYSARTPADIKILDWGCGKGHITHLLRSRGFDVTSCDISRDSDDSTFGQETPLIEELGISVVPLVHPSKLPFADSSFDCVVSFGVLEHVRSDHDSLVELHRVLKPGGVFYVTFLPYFLSWTQAVSRVRGNRYHDRLYNKRGLGRLAGETGFRVCWLERGQLLPKNSMPLPLDRFFEPIDRFLCAYTPFSCFATNLEAVLLASKA
jgi:SAM-dependent methyltransferase